MVPKNGTVEDLINALVKKAQLEDEAKAGPIEIYEIHSNKIHRELSRDYQVISITDYTTMIAERVPEENLPEEADGHLIQCFHFQGEPTKAHGIPFRFRVIEVRTFSFGIQLYFLTYIKGEKFIDTKKRLEKRTGFKGKNFEKIKFALVKRASYSKPIYLSDGTLLHLALRARPWTNFIADSELGELIVSVDDMLGLDHIDRSRVIRNGAGDLFLK